MSLTIWNWVGIILTVALIVFFVLYKFFLYSVRYNTVMVLSRGGKITRILPEGYHWVMPWDRIEQITFKIGSEPYFKGNRVPLKMQFNSIVKTDVKGMTHEYKIFVMFVLKNVEVFLRLDTSPMDVFYGVLVAEFNRTMQVKPFVWSDVEKMMDDIKLRANKSLSEMGVQIAELKVLWATEDEELAPILKKNELQRITGEMDMAAEKNSHALQMARLRHEKELIQEYSNNEAFRRKRQEEIANL